MHHTATRLVLAGLFLVATCGCGGSQVKTVPVSGAVTLDGQPLAGATITFQPVDGQTIAPGSHGKTDAKGQYQLQVTVTRQAGAVPGKHRVRISSARTTTSDDAVLPVEDRVPARYRDGSETFEVPTQGTDKADFRMTSK
jgi:hypothetical protein